jgi:hypothetical protein
MLATLWSLGYARQCEDELIRAQHQSASPEIKQANRNLAELEWAAATRPSMMEPRDEL